MEKTKPAVKRQLKEQWEKVCNGYLAELLRMWGLDDYYGYWGSDQPGTIYHYGETYNLTMEEIIYIVENDIEEDEVFEWENTAWTHMSLDSTHRTYRRGIKDVPAHRRRCSRSYAS